MTEQTQAEQAQNARSAAKKAERRRRNTDALSGRRKRLSLDESKLDKQNFVYRWANDERGRIHALTVEDDWEVVSDRDGALKPDAAGDGSQVTHRAGVGEQGAALNAVLLRKPRAYHDDDYAARQRRIDENEKLLTKGKAPGAQDDGHSYVPEGGISLKRG